MAFQQDNNSGALFKNERKELDSHPNAKGSATIDGVEYWVSAWTNTSRQGAKYQSLRFQRKDDQPGRTEAPNNQGADFDDDIPF